MKIENLPLAVLGLGKLGGGRLDYDSDLDLVIVFDAEAFPSNPGAVATGEFYSKAVEIFTNALSSITREGSLYRVDLRLRPYGSKGTVAISSDGMLEYMRFTSEVWELLAFVMLRPVGGDLKLGHWIETELRQAIFQRASQFSDEELATQTRRVRLALEKQRAKTRRSKDIDIKYGAGGLLDVYFVTRFLQLRDHLPNDSGNRSATATLDRLLQLSSLPKELHGDLSAGYTFLASLDHNIRLTVGRTSRIPDANRSALEAIASRMALSSTNELFDQLTLHRLSIRAAFESIIGGE